MKLDEQFVVIGSGDARRVVRCAVVDIVETRKDGIIRKAGFAQWNVPFAVQTAFDEKFESEMIPNVWWQDPRDSKYWGV
ncbi:hypothetical protein KFU94_37750 [Chloroflexi bacterium TSY]|nr:hypothetical protein [Chloroflexi bacterium TSY]